MAWSAVGWLQPVGWCSPTGRPRRRRRSVPEVAAVVSSGCSECLCGRARTTRRRSPDPSRRHRRRRQQTDAGCCRVLFLERCQSLADRASLLPRCGTVVSPWVQIPPAPLAASSGRPLPRQRRTCGCSSAGQSATVPSWRSRVRLPSPTPNAASAAPRPPVPPRGGSACAHSASSAIEPAGLQPVALRRAGRARRARRPTARPVAPRRRRRRVDELRAATVPPLCTGTAGRPRNRASHPAGGPRRYRCTPLSPTVSHPARWRSRVCRQGSSRHGRRMAVRTVQVDDTGVFVEANGTRFRPCSRGGYAPAHTRFAANQRVRVADGPALIAMGQVRVGERPLTETWRAEPATASTVQERTHR